MNINAADAISKVEQLEQRALHWKNDPGDANEAVVDMLANGVVALAFVVRQYVEGTTAHAYSCMCEPCQYIDWLNRTLDDVLG